jgi:3-oxoacyl-[acyl-carrier-protein] synthase II
MDPALAAAIPRATHFGIAAAQQALAGANFSIDAHNCERVGVMLANGGAGALAMEDLALRAGRSSDNGGWHAVGPGDLLCLLSSSTATTAAVALGARGPVMAHALACASSLYSLLEAYHFIRRGEADVIVAGGVEASITPISLAAFGRMGALAENTGDPSGVCRPFSVDRHGLIFGEGAGALVLESEAHAAARGATPLAEIKGGKLTGDAYHITAPDPSGQGAARAIRGALQMAAVEPHAVSAVYAHGTGTQLNDSTESLALCSALGPAAQHIPVTAIKSSIGHGFGAAGAQAAVAAVRTLQQGMLPPTLNYTPDPAIEVPIAGNTAQPVDARHVLINAFGFGGHNVVLVLGRI